MPKEKTRQIVRYCAPNSMTSWVSVWLAKKMREPARPKRANRAQLMAARNTPLAAARFASSWRRSPKERDKSALIPTQVPEDTAIKRLCTGKARDTAVRAFSLICATKMLSTIL